MRIALILLGLAVTLVAQSQEIYRWVDKNGVVHYSDQPDSPNAVLINVIEPNAYEAQVSAPGTNRDSGGAGEREDETASYASLSIVSPTPDQVFFGADAVVNVVADLQGDAPARPLGGLLPERQPQSGGRPQRGFRGARAGYVPIAREHPGRRRSPGDHQPADDFPRAPALGEFAAEPDGAAAAHAAQAGAQAGAQAQTFRRLTAAHSHEGFRGR